MPVPDTVNDSVVYAPRNVYSAEDILVDIDDGNRLDIYGDVYLNGEKFNSSAVFDVRKYGAKGNGTTSDSAAIQAAINAATVNGGTVYFPPTPNFYLITTPLVLKSYVQFLGDHIGFGNAHTILRSSTNDLFIASDVLYGNSFTGLTLWAGIGAGHIFNNAGFGLSGWQLERCSLLQQNNAKSIMVSAGGDVLELHMRYCWSQHVNTATVPSWNLVSANNAINCNSWRDSRIQYSGDYHFHIESTGTGYSQDNVFENLNMEQCLGGEIRLRSCRTTVMSNIAGYDGGTYTKSRISIEKGPLGSFSQSNKCFQVVRRGGALGAGAYDIQCSQSGRTTVELCNGSINFGNGGGTVGNIILGVDSSSPNGTLVAGNVYEDNIWLDNNDGTVVARRNRIMGTAGEGYVEFFAEQSTGPAAPAANGCRLYTKDNGSGKTQLMAIFNTGAPVQVAIQP